MFSAERCDPVRPVENLLSRDAGEPTVPQTPRKRYPAKVTPPRCHHCCYFAFTRTTAPICFTPLFVPGDPLFMCCAFTTNFWQQAANLDALFTGDLRGQEGVCRSGVEPASFVFYENRSLLLWVNYFCI